MTQLTDKEANELFAQASAAIKAADETKLSEVMAVSDVEDDEDQDTTDDVDTDTEDDLPDDDVDTSAGDTAEEDDPTDDDDTTVEDSALEELRAQLAAAQKENHALRSQAGRVPHIQRKLTELDAKLAELNKKAATPSDRTSTAVTEQVKAALKGIGETDAELAEAVAQAIQLAVKAQEDESINNQKATLTLLREQEYAAYREEQASRLIDMYPNAREVFASATWKQWKNTQSERVHALAQSDNADEVALAFKLYAEDMVRQNPALATKTAAADTTVNDTAAAENAQKAAQIEQARKRRQAAAAHVGSSNAQGKVRLPDDPEALFKKFSEEIRKNISGE